MMSYRGSTGLVLFLRGCLTYAVMVKLMHLAGVPSLPASHCSSICSTHQCAGARCNVQIAGSGMGPTPASTQEWGYPGIPSDAEFVGCPEHDLCPFHYFSEHHWTDGSSSFLHIQPHSVSHYCGWARPCLRSSLHQDFPRQLVIIVNRPSLAVNWNCPWHPLFLCREIEEYLIN